MWITFIQDHKVKQGDGNGPLYEQGKSYEFKGFVAETYANKYIARGYAVEGKPEPKVEPKPFAATPGPTGSEGPIGVVGTKAPRVVKPFLPAAKVVDSK